MKRRAIQGLVGSFHDIAAHLYFEGEQIQLICCSTFEEVFRNMKQDPTAIGMLAIENTIAGCYCITTNCCVIVVRPLLANINCISPTASAVCPTTIGAR